MTFAVFVFFPNQLVYSSSVKPREAINYSDTLILKNQEDEIVTFNDNDIVVLDFWTTSCGICFEKFPDYEQVFYKYSNNKNVKIYSVNVSLKKDTPSKTKDLVQALGYKFPTLYADGILNKKKLDRYGIRSYPHLLIIKNNKIQYSGRMENNPLIFIYNINDEIKRIANL